MQLRGSSANEKVGANDISKRPLTSSYWDQRPILKLQADGRPEMTTFGESSVMVTWLISSCHHFRLLPLMVIDKRIVLRTVSFYVYVDTQWVPEGGFRQPSLSLILFCFYPLAGLVQAVQLMPSLMSVSKCNLNYLDHTVSSLYD